MEHRPDAPPEEFDVPVADTVRGDRAGFGDRSLEDVAELEALGPGSGPDSESAMEFRRTLGMFATGVTVITTEMNGQAHGLTVNAFMSVSLQPPLVLISIDRRTRMNGLLEEGIRFGISVLAVTQSVLSDYFGGRPRDEATEPSIESVGNTPLVEGALAQLVARVVGSYWGEITRSSSDTSSTSGTARASRFSSTAVAMNASCATPVSSRPCRASCWSRSSRPGPSGRLPTARR